MRGLAVGIVGALVLALAAAGLAVGWLRDGPHDVEAAPTAVVADATGTLERRPSGTTVAGVCPVPPCGPRTAVSLRFTGLPDLPYVARLDGGGTADLGPLRQENGGHRLEWSEDADHAAKGELVLSVAGRDVARHPVPWPQAGTTTVDWELPVGWGSAPAEVHLNEVGAVAVSTVALAELDEVPPEGLEFRAALRPAGGSGSGLVDLGAFEARDGRSVLDGRVERVRLADHGSVLVVLVAEGRSLEAGLPVLEGAF